jgi:peptide/nickel transport system substrate-binding protein
MPTEGLVGMGNRIHDSDGMDDQSSISRRQLLALSSGAAMAGLAGCFGQDPDEPDVSDLTNDGTNSGGDGGGKSATTLSIRAPISWTPKNANINPFATQGDIEYWMQYMWWEALTYPNAVGEPIRWLAKDISLEKGGCRVVITLKDDYTWWDGAPVTAKDVWITEMISDYQGFGGPDQTDDSWEVTGKYELVHELPGPANPALEKSSYLSLVSKHDYFKSWLEKFQDASGKKSVDKVARNLNNHEITLKDLTDKGLGCGLWKPVQYDPTQVISEKHQDHPRADWTNLDAFEWVLIADDQKAIQAMQAGRFDMGDKLLRQAESNDKLEIFSEFITTGLPKLTMNFNNKHLARRPVRRAIAHLIDHEELVQVIKAKQGQPYKPHRNVTGMSRMLYDQWLPNSFREKFIDYGVNAQPRKAEQTLTDAGYSKKGDVWVGPDGDSISGIQYLTPPWSIYETIGKYISPKLKNFGIKNKLIIPSSSGFWQTWSETYDFDMCNWFATTSHPAYAFSTASAQGLGMYDKFVKVKEKKSKSCMVDRSVPELEQKRSIKLNHPIRPQYPTKVGAEERNGKGQTLYPIKWNNIMSQTQDESEVQDLTKKLAWFYNWQVPHIGFYNETRSYWGRTDKFSFPQPSKVDNHPSAKATLTEHKTSAMEFLTKGHIDAKK